nr:immunoglobulin light chain junction region [Macaca mulatta]
CMQPLEFPWMF